MLEKHLLRAVGTSLACALVHEQAIAHCLPTESVTQANRAEVTARLPASASKALDRVAKLLTGKSVDAFLEEVEAAAASLQIKLPGTDKRTMRCVLDFLPSFYASTLALTRRSDALIAHREQLKTALEAETGAPTALQLAVLLFLHRSKQRALHLPTKLISRAIEALQKLLPAASFAVLSAFSADVVELLRIRAEAQREGGAGGGDREKQLEAKLAEALPALKAAVFAPETEEERAAAKSAAKGGKDEAPTERKKGRTGKEERSGKDEREEAAPVEAERKGGRRKEAEVEAEPAAPAAAAPEEAVEEASEASPAAGKGRRRRAQQ